MQPLSKTQLRFYKRRLRIEELARNFNWDFLNVQIENINNIIPKINENNNNNDDEAEIDSLTNNDNLVNNKNIGIEFFNLENENLLLFEINVYSDENEEEEFRIETNEKKVYAALIALFFRVNITQSDFKLVIEFAQLLTPIKLPKDFDRIMAQVNQTQLKYNKKWFCQNCGIYVTLSNSKERVCLDCNNKSEILF